jgi:hypothetical protein
LIILVKVDVEVFGYDNGQSRVLVPSLEDVVSTLFTIQVRADVGTNDKPSE